jgi:hypothetical protein
VARLSAAEVEREVRADLGNMVLLEAIEAQAKQIRRDFARLARRQERQTLPGVLLLASDTLPPLLVWLLATAGVRSNRGTARSRHEPGRSSHLTAGPPGQPAEGDLPPGRPGLFP